MSAENQHIELYQLITKKLNAELSSEEEIHLDKLLLKKENQKIYEDTLLLWKQAPSATIQVDAQAALSKINNRIIAKQEKKTRSPWLMVAAASVALIASIFLFLPGNQSNQVARISIQTEHLTEIQSVLIPDGTKVDINLNSTLEYPEVFSESAREVTLSGKAFFDVAHNEKQPFVIHTEQIDIQVLGTSFYVHSDKNENEIFVSVVTGKVKLTDQKNDRNSITITKGQKGIFNKKTRSFEAVTTNVNDYFWKTKTLVYKNTSFEAVVKSINTHYDTEITVVGELRQQAIETTFENNTTDEIIQILQALSDCSVSQKGQKIILE